MAACENDFQIALKDEVKELGGKALRIRHFSLAGIMDVIWKRPNGAVTWIECKYSKDQKCKKLELKTTALQKVAIREWGEVGVNTGWAFCHRVNSTTWKVYVGVHELKHVTEEDFLYIRKRGKPWEIQLIEERLMILNRKKRV